MTKPALAPAASSDHHLKYDVSTHFGFGENWADYAQHITEEKIRLAEQDLLRLLPHDKIEGKTFLDIGCGSGLHALAALRSGCKSLSAVDFDPNSVQTTRTVLKKFWQAENYSVQQANILDPQSLTGFPEKSFDVVYSWGVLHHTGDMWQAISNAAKFVKDEGVFVLAIYKETPLCPFWKKEKSFYTKAPKAIKKICDLFYAASYILGLLVTHRNPFTYIREYEQMRGMRFMTDVRDWLGGYPYESASPDQIKTYLENLGFQQEYAFNTRTTSAGGLFGTGCAEYVFVKR
jgi:2-polyprenyl-3-methyl-5-hydroxy-6-metoxy-1,4-benzoquinol methylase